MLPPFIQYRLATVVDHFPFMSLRNFFYDHLERRELLGSEVKAVVPVSNHLGALLKSKYPSVRKNLSEAIHPGVSISIKTRRRRIVPTNGNYWVYWKRMEEKRPAKSY